MQRELNVILSDENNLSFLLVEKTSSVRGTTTSRISLGGCSETKDDLETRITKSLKKAKSFYPTLNWPSISQIVYFVTHSRTSYNVSDVSFAL